MCWLLELTHILNCIIIVNVRNIFRFLLTSLTPILSNIVCILYVLIPYHVVSLPYYTFPTILSTLNLILFLYHPFLYHLVSLTSMSSSLSPIVFIPIPYSVHFVFQYNTILLIPILSIMLSVYFQSQSNNSFPLFLGQQLNRQERERSSGLH